MCHVTVRYVGLVRRLAQVGEDRVELPEGATLSQLLDALRQRRGEDLYEALVGTSGRLCEGAWVTVGERHVDELQGLETPLSGADDVILASGIHPIAGGSGLMPPGTGIGKAPGSPDGEAARRGGQPVGTERPVGSGLEVGTALDAGAGRPVAPGPDTATGLDAGAGRAPRPAAPGDAWIHTVCDGCYSYCGVLVHRVDGRVVKIEGDPDCPHSAGRVCAKGHAGLMSLYDPNRLTTPLVRTNPAKGTGVDPGWKAIGWDEAMALLTERLGALRADDPRRLAVSTWDVPVAHNLVSAWCSAFGTPNHAWVGYFCGNYLHSSMYLTNGTFHSDFDVEHCQYVILLGNQAGFMAGLNPNITAQKMAAARARGLHVVAVDPVCSHAGSKADEWVPIRPGTDGALVLAMIHVLLHELGLYDAPFLREHTNAPYLVGEDGLYVRDADGRPLIWDEVAGAAVPYDTPGASPCLEGRLRVGEASCRPAFDLLLEHLRAWTPEVAERITSVPAGTVRRLAREFGEAARIGATIRIGERTLPYRPVAVNIYRGAGAHVHGVHVALAVQILNMVVGAFYRPGGHRGVNLVGPDATWRPGTEDGLVAPPPAIGHGAKADYYHFNPRAPETLGIYELFPLSTNRSPMYELASRDPGRFALPYEPEVLMVCRRNHFLSNAARSSTEAMLRRYRFVVFFGTHLDEVAEFADLALPDAHFLEKLELFPNQEFLSVAPSTGYFYWGVRQPVVDPPQGVRPWTDVLLELAVRLDFEGDLYRMLNGILHLRDPHTLDAAEHYTREEIYDRWAQSKLGDEHGLPTLRQAGYHRVPRTVDDLYPTEPLGLRFPLYFENLPRAGAAVRDATRAAGIAWETGDYAALPVWKPCPAFREAPGDGLYAVNFRLPTQYQSVSAQNPWLQELAQANPYAQRILMNGATAASLGLRDGDRVEVVSEAGRVEGVLRATELVHPEVVGISGHFGAWARGKPVARGHGANFNQLLPMDLSHIDWVSSGVDSCVRVHVRRLSGGPRNGGGRRGRAAAH